MLPHKPETMQQMKARFGRAIAETISVENAPSENRDHVFDFEDGMRMVVTVDCLSGSEFLHVSVSGNDDYNASIQSEGIKGVMEDMFLRLAAISGKAPSRPITAKVDQKNILHVMFNARRDK